MNYDFSQFNQQLSDLQKQYQQMNSQMFNTPIMPQQIQIPIPSHQVQYVEGINGARIYQQSLPNNSSEIIMDKDENIFYYVSKDANGTPSKKITIGHFNIEENSDEEPAFLTKKDLELFKEEIKEMFRNKEGQVIEKTAAPVRTVTKEATK